MPIAETEKLKQSLMDELTMAQKRVTESSEAIGVQETGQFMPKALRLKGRVIVEKELSDLQGSFDTAIEKLAGEAAFLNEAETAKFKNNLKNKLNAMTLALIEKSGLVQKQIANMKLDQAQSNAILGAIGQTAGALAKGIISGIAPKSSIPQSGLGLDSALPISAEEEGPSFFPKTPSLLPSKRAPSLLPERF